MAICNFSLAVTSGYGDRKSTLWLRCSVFGKRAEGSLPEYLVKGAQVAVSGELSLNEWEKDGVKHSTLELNVNTLDLIGGNRGNNSGGQDERPVDDSENSVPF